jgi:succinate dehydrogenase flavin-adding protein (antitoxin of CptAB toxin-antitoxin module)
MAFVLAWRGWREGARDADTRIERFLEQHRAQHEMALVLAMVRGELALSAGR